MEDLGSIPGLGRPSGWEDSQRREQLPTAVFWPEEFHEHRRLAGYSPWGCKELDKTEQLSLSLFTNEIILPGKASVAQLYPTLCNPIDCNLLSSSVHGNLQARILDWVAMLSFRESSWPEIEPGSPALQADSLPPEPHTSRRPWTTKRTRKLPM